MKFRYFINSNWTILEATEVMRALEFAASYYDLTTGISNIKLISNFNDSNVGDFLRVKSNKFELRFNKTASVSLKELRLTVFHEMTHVKQSIKDGLRLEGRNSKFKGINYNSDDMEYWIRPWEIEARGMEGALEAFYVEDEA